MLFIKENSTWYPSHRLTSKFEIDLEHRLARETNKITSIKDFDDAPATCLLQKGN